MFGLFKKKKKPEEPASLPVEEAVSRPAEPAAEAEAAPEAVSVDEVQLQPATQNEAPEPMPVSAAPAEADLSGSADQPAAALPAAAAQPAEQPEPTLPTATVETPVAEPIPALGWAARLKQGLSKSRNQMAKSLAGVFGGGQIDEDLYEELETVLLTADMGIEATEQLMAEVRKRVSLRGLKDGQELRSALKEAIYDLIKPLEAP